MKSVLVRRHGGPEVLELVDGPDPKPMQGQVVIRVRAMAVSRPDILIRKGLYAWAPPLPANPGNELAGVVESVGPGVGSVSVGQSVLLSARELPVRGGCYAEVVAAPASSIHVLPEGVELSQAVVLPTYLVAHAMLTRLSITGRAKSIFVNGVAGGVGSALADLGRCHGIRVIGSVGSAPKGEFARSLGVSDLVFYKSDALADRVMSLTDGRGVDASFDHVIGPRFVDCVRMLATFGTAVAYNVFSPMPDSDIFGEMRELSKRSLCVRVFNMHSFDGDQAALRQLTSELIELLAAKKIEPRVSHQMPLSEVAQAHRLVENGEVMGKVVLTA